MTKRKQPSGAPASSSNPAALTVQMKPKQTREEAIADIAACPVMIASTVTMAFSKSTFGELPMMETIAVLRGKVDAVHGGDLREAETMLTGQAIALNAIFAELARRAALNMGEHLNATERYMRLALKAQGQCRATLETLATLKNPPVIFARQANVTTGPQQINNGVSASRVREIETEQSKLLETDHEQQLDITASSTTGRANKAVETVGSQHRATDA